VKTSFLSWFSFASYFPWCELFSALIDSIQERVNVEEREFVRRQTI
jgi:hypothetical protein